MKIKILVVGKTKHSWCVEGEKEYSKRLQGFCDLEKIEVPEEKMTPAVSTEEVKKREGEKLLARIPTGFLIVALSPDGKKISSAEFAGFLQEIKDFKGGKLGFLIGGPLGLGASVLKHADAVISFSAMTFPHDLFRLILTEQIYRGFTLLEGKKYHY